MRTPERRRRVATPDSLPVFNLCSRIDVAATEAAVAAYVAANGENISANRVRRAEERRLAEAEAAPPPPDTARLL